MAENITYLAKLGELTLKGSNLKEFENRLTANVKLYLESVKATVRLRAGRLYIEGPEESCAAIEFTLQHLIGITGWARTTVCEKDIMAIRKAVYQEAVAAKEGGAKSFKIESRRADKNFPMNSYQISCEAATDVFDQGLLEVQLQNPDVIIRVEVREKVFVYCDRNKGCRGLPVGTGGHGLLLLSGGLDSPVAGYRMMRRGMKVDCVYFHAYPYTSAEAQQKVEDLAKIIARYGVDTHINIIPFTEVQMRIRQRAPENFSTLLLRMCMMRAATLLADRIKAHCLISGESLGQVASQTVQNMAVTASASPYPLLRPLVGLDKEEIVETAKAIGTYETSILPYEDCCVLFSPKHPVLRASVEEAQRLYQELDAEELIQAAFDKREHKRFSVQEYITENFSKKE
ncbi:MAG: tRNA 4-thiouridine(8) synthase ThiI [Spirochaetaceae bacterium]|nr:tRNA 4-thiouridine(8) synthase ThiI [Spirochaetaceae bacterium]MDY3754756.1 tRNA uracil 4-sulfurtransferase ThiI [Treponema sp.]